MLIFNFQFNELFAFPKNSCPISPFWPLNVHTNHSFCLECSLLVHTHFFCLTPTCARSQPKCHFFQYAFSASFQLHEKRDQIYLVPTNLQLLKENLKHGRICLKLSLRYAGYRMNITQVYQESHNISI